MNNIRTLAAMTVGAILLSVFFAVALNDTTREVDIDGGEERSVQHVESGDEGEFILKDEGRFLKAKWRGPFKVSASGADIEKLERYLEIFLKKDGVERRAVFKRDDEDEISRRLYVDNEKQPVSAETDEEIAVLLKGFLRASGMNAKERVAALVRIGGADAVLEEIALLEGDHALRRYVMALTKTADLDAEQIDALIGYASAIEGDHELSRSLQAILQYEDVPASLTPALLTAAASIDSSHDLRKLVEAIAKRPLDNETTDLALDMFRRIDSDHDLRQAALALLDNDALMEEGAPRILAAAARAIDSDHDMRTLLEITAPDFTKNASFRDAWLDGLGSIDSDYDKRVSIERVVSAGGVARAEDWRALIDATEDIDGSYDKRLALVAIAEKFDAAPELLVAYRDAAEGIDSDFDRENALEALLDR
ncbi:MAG: hypothetical protein AAGA09_07000 [Pseudomonadota bacterium]